jgi:hypothetical protein
MNIGRKMGRREEMGEVENDWEIRERKGGRRRGKVEKNINKYM